MFSSCEVATASLFPPSLSSQGGVFLYWFLFSTGACTCELVSGKKQLGARLTIIIHFAGRAGLAGGGVGGARSIRDGSPGSTTLNDVTCGTDTIVYTPLPSVTDIITAAVRSTSTLTIPLLIYFRIIIVKR